MSALGQKQTAPPESGHVRRNIHASTAHGTIKFKCIEYDIIAVRSPTRQF